MWSHITAGQSVLGCCVLDGGRLVESSSWGAFRAGPTLLRWWTWADVGADGGAPSAVVVVGGKTGRLQWVYLTFGYSGLLEAMKKYLHLLHSRLGDEKYLDLDCCLQPVAPRVVETRASCLDLFFNN